MIKRAILYLKRKNKRSILLFLLLFVISFSLAIGVTVWNSIGAVTKEVQDRLGTGFIVRMNASTYDPTNQKNEVGSDGTTYKVYTGPLLDDETIAQIMQIDGITRYNADNYLNAYPHLDNLQLISGMWNQNLQDRIVHPEDYENEDAERVNYTTMRSRATTVFGNSDTSLAAKFRTGVFELVEGRHICPEDQHVVLLSDELAAMNNLKVGDTISMTFRDGAVMTDDALAILGEPQILEIVGLFHVNGYQPTGRFVSENDITYNWAFTDLDTVKALEHAKQQAMFGVNYEFDPQYQNVTFFVTDAQQLDRIMEQVKGLHTIDVDAYEITVDDTMYKSTVEPLKSIRNIVAGVVGVIVAGCSIVLCVVFTMWVRSRRTEIAIYLSLGISKFKIIGQFVLEATIVAIVALVLTFATCQQVPNLIGNSILTSTIEAAQPEEKEYSWEEIGQAAMSGTTSELFQYESSEYAGPEQIDFSFGLVQLLVLAALELLIIIAAICKGGSFIFRLQPRQILTTLR